MPIRSAARSSAGPDVLTNLPPISVATMCARVVLPRPGGPLSSRWSSGSWRWRAACERDRQASALQVLADELVEVARPQSGLETLFSSPLTGAGRDSVVDRHAAGLPERCEGARWARKYSVMMSWTLVTSSRVASS